MSGETTPSAPSEKLPSEMSTADLRELLRQREEEERLAGAATPDTESSPVESDDPTTSYLEPGDPEKLADDRNRAIDHEILGKAVRLKHDINSKAGEAVSKVDQLFAKAKNLVGKPREVIRKWHMNRAEKSLEKKEDRLAKKQQEWKEKLDATSSGRLQKYRQEKATRDVEKAQAKVDKFRTNRVERRRDDYRDITELHSSRLEKSSSRQGEREQSATEARQEAINRKAEAQGRKELRKRLRGPENKAGLLETRRVINDILGEENAPALLRQLGRDVISQQYAQRDLGRSKSELSHTKSATERIPGLITKEQGQQKSHTMAINVLTRDLTRIEGVLNGKYSEDTVRSELEAFNGSPDDANIFTQENVRYIRSVLTRETEQLESSKQREKELADKLAGDQSKYTEQAQAALSAQRAADRERERVDAQAKTILS